MAPDPVSCHWVANGTSRPGSTEHWADVFGWVGAKATVEETTGTSHGLGVALQVGTGSWGASGSSTLDEATGTGRSEPNVWDVSVHNRVNYTGYTYACAPHPDQHKLVATGTYSLLSSDTNITHWIGTGCQIYNSGSYWKDSVSNATYSTGVTLSGVINVSAHAGWTSTTKTEWVINSPTRVCGNSTSRPDSSWKVEAHSYS